MSSDNENEQKEDSVNSVRVTQEGDKFDESGVELCMYIEYIKYVKRKCIIFR